MSHLNPVLENKSDSQEVVCKLEGGLIQPFRHQVATTAQDPSRG